MTRSRKTRATPNPRARSHPSADVRHPPSSFCSRPPLHSALHHRGPAALLRDRTLSITLLLAALPFACLPDTDIREDTISDPQGCRTIHIIDDDDTATSTTTETATSTSTSTSTGTSTSASTSTTTSGTDSDTTTIEVPVCGNNMVETGEDCDDGNTVLDDTCPADCRYHCGDGFAHGDPDMGGEPCDDGNDVNTDDCTNDCTLAACGDNYPQEENEECDNGDDNGDDNLCSGACTLNCGDGIVQPATEQCDDAKNGDDLDGCTDDCTLRYTVFVTSETYAGDLKLMGVMDEVTGLELADLRCQTLADNAGFKGKFLAWLSDSTGSPSSRFETATEEPLFAGTFALPNGTPVAVGWEGLTTEDGDDNLLLHAIDMDENSDTQIGASVWSNTTIKGLKKGEDHCSNWASDADLESGRRGKTNYLDERWTDLGNSACDFESHLYCFQVTHP